MSELQRKPEIVVFAGPNGSGKSKLMSLLLMRGLAGKKKIFFVTLDQTAQKKNLNVKIEKQVVYEEMEPLLRLMGCDRAVALFSWGY